MSLREGEDESIRMKKEKNEGWSGEKEKDCGGWVVMGGWGVAGSG